MAGIRRSGHSPSCPWCDLICSPVKWGYHPVHLPPRNIMRVCGQELALGSTPNPWGGALCQWLRLGGAFWGKGLSQKLESPMATASLGQVGAALHLGPRAQGQQEVPKPGLLPQLPYTLRLQGHRWAHGPHCVGSSPGSAPIYLLQAASQSLSQGPCWPQLCTPYRRPPQRVVTRPFQ